MFWSIIIAIGIYITYQFVTAVNKDKLELEHQTVEEKFQFVVAKLNQVVFDGQGNLTKLSNRSFNLYKEGENQIIHFHYSTGILRITWKYKYFQKEVIHKRDFDNARNLSVFEQTKMGEIMISEMMEIIKQHKVQVLGIENQGLLGNYVLSLAEKQALDFRPAYFVNTQDAMNTIKRLATNTGCAVIDLKSNFLSQISEFDEYELLILAEEFDNKKEEESLIFNIHPDDTGAAIMSDWITDYMTSKYI